MKHNGGARRRSLCTWIDPSQKIKSLKRQKLFWFGVALASSGVTYLWLKNTVLLPHTAAAISAASFSDEMLMPLQRGLYEVISSNPDVMAKIGSHPAIGRPYYFDASSTSATIRFNLYNNGQCVGDGTLKMPGPGEGSGSRAELAKKSTSLHSELDPLFGWQVELQLGGEVIKVPVPSLKERGYDMDKIRDHVTTSKIV